MAIFSILKEFSAAQAIATQTANDSTNILDLGANGDSLVKRGVVHVQVNTAFATSASGTLTVTIQTCATVGGSYTTLWTSAAAIAVGTLVAGYKITGKDGIPLPSGVLRYLKVVYTVNTGAMSAGKCDAWLSNAEGGDSNKFTVAL